MDYKLIWADYFNQDQIDTSIWQIDEVGGTSGNNEAQYYSQKNAFIKDQIMLQKESMQRF